MRQVKFRAKAVKDKFFKGEWVYGYYIKRQYGNKLVDTISDGYSNTYIPIQSETLGQASGLYDKNHNEIYEGDIVILVNGLGTFEVVFRHGGFGYIDGNSFYLLGANTNFGFFRNDFDSTLKIVGNIHDKDKRIK